MAEDNKIRFGLACIRRHVQGYSMPPNLRTLGLSELLTMNKTLVAILAAIGVSSMTQAEPQVQMIDPKKINFTMPTVAADDIQFVMPTKESVEGAPQFHEDEWCQLEFYPPERLSEIQKLLTEYKTFEKKHRIQYGWDQIYARRISRKVIVRGSDAAEITAKSIQASVRPAPILTTTSRPLGQVKDGFTLELPGSVFLYGLRTKDGINTLGAIVERGGDDSQLTKAFMALSKKYQLLLVDWRSQQVLVSMSEKGSINVWRP